MPISVLLADDTAIIRKAVRSLLDSHSDLVVVGEATDFAATVNLIETLRPNIVVMDLHMPGEFKINPAEVKSQLRKVTSRLLAISIWDDDDSRALADSFGATALLSKIDLANTLVPAIIDLHRPKARAAAD
jgi:DNA-binding NarL/FixJ family response regulator